MSVERRKGDSAPEVRLLALRDRPQVFAVQMALCEPEVNDVHVFIVLRQNEVRLWGWLVI
jgi:hypothetical protein